MTYTRPRYDTWATRTVTAIFLLFVGGLINQFWNIPTQRAQIDALRAEIAETHKQVFYINTPMLKTLTDQHVIIMAEQSRQARLLQEMNERLDNHDRRSRRR